MVTAITQRRPRPTSETLFTFEDDGPMITEPRSTRPQTRHPYTSAAGERRLGRRCAGTFGYDIGSDGHSDAFYVAGGSDFVDANGGVTGVQLWLSGTICGTPVPRDPNTRADALFRRGWQRALFNFSLRLRQGPDHERVQTGTATGTLGFDKDAETYTVEMDTPVEGLSFNILHTSELLAKQPTGNTGHPNIVVERLAVDDPNTTLDEDFYVQFTANTTHRRQTSDWVRVQLDWRRGACR